MSTASKPAQAPRTEWEPASGSERFGVPPEGWRLTLYRVIFESDTPAGARFDMLLLVAIVTSVIVVMIAGRWPIRICLTSGNGSAVARRGGASTSALSAEAAARKSRPLMRLIRRP
jgi:hypothetical protein